MADVTDTFSINLDVSGADSVDSAAVELENLAAQIKGSKSEIGAMRSALNNMRGSGNVATSTFQTLKDRIADHTVAIAESQARYVELGGSFARTGSSAAAMANQSKVAADAQTSAIVKTSTAQKELAKQAEAVALASLNEKAALSVVGMSAQQLETDLISGSIATAKLEDEIRSIGPASTATAGTLDKLTSRLDKQKAVMRAASSRFIGLGGDITKVKSSVSASLAPTDSMITRLASLGEGAALLPGPLGQTVAQMGPLRSLMAGGMLGATIVLAAALIALGAAVVFVTGKFLAYGVGLAAARREQELTLDGLIAATGKIRAQADTGSSLAASIRRVADTTSSTTAEIDAFAQTLFKAKLRGSQLETALEAVAITSMAAGSTAASAFIKSATAAAAAGKSIDAVAAKANKAFGEIAANKALAFSRQLTRLKERLGRVFGDLKIDGFLRSFTVLSNMFQDGSAEADAMKSLFEGLFQPMIDGAGRVLPLVRRGMFEILIAVFKVGTAYRQVKNAISDALDSSALGRWIKAEGTTKLWEGAVLAAKVAIVGLGIAIGVTLLPVVIAVGAGMLAWAAIAAVLDGVVVAVNFLGNSWTKMVESLNPDGLVSTFDAMMLKVFDSLMSIDFVKAGVNMIDGLVSGVLSAVGKVGAAFKSVASAAFSAFNGEAEIRSPSRRMMRSGADVGEGAAIGAESKISRVKVAARKLAIASIDTGTRTPTPALPRPVTPAAAAQLPRVETPSAALSAPAITLGPERAAAAGVNPAIQTQAPAVQVSPTLLPAPPIVVPPALSPQVPELAPGATTTNNNATTTNNNATTTNNAAASKTTTTTINMGGVEITITPEAGATSKDVAQEIWEELVRKFEGSAISVGAQV